MKKFIAILLFLVFWFKGDTLYWADITPDIYDGIRIEKSLFNCLRFQLNKKMPPDINTNPIETITIKKDMVRVITKDKYWEVHCEGNSMDWYVEGPFDY